jgi:protein gp37
VSDKTGISWTNSTWNPIVGCSKVSPGCDNCYAIRDGARLQHLDTYAGTIEDGDWTGVVRCLPERLDQPVRWKRPRRIFVNSMADLFHPDVPEPFIGEVFDVTLRAPQHIFQVLTKRPQRMASVLGRFRTFGDGWFIGDGGEEMAFPNVWLGTSIESDKFAFRANHLRETPAALRFLSLEPLLGPLPNVDLDGIDWVIVGGESGPRARPMHPQWVRDIRDRCVEAGVPFHFKQWGAWGPAGSMYDTSERTHLVQLDGRDRGIPWGGWKLDQPLAEPMRRFGPKVARRELDGAVWDQFPDSGVQTAPSPAG